MWGYFKALMLGRMPGSKPTLATSRISQVSASMLDSKFVSEPVSSAEPSNAHTQGEINPIMTMYGRNKVGYLGI